VKTVRQIPDLVRRIVAEGHEIGNHSFTHPNLGEVPNELVDLEMNTTQRLIESLTGRSTRLFRAPYFGDAEPRTPEQVGPTVAAQNLGYISVGLHLDPDDWKLTNEDGSPHTSDQMVEEVLAAAKINTPEERGSIVLLHDSGGDRSATVEALPKLIHELRANGYEFTTVADLAGITPDQAMPPIMEDQSFYARADAFVFYTASLTGWLIRWLFVLGIVLGIGRMTFIGILALTQFIRSKRREKIHFGESFEPLVSVVVPAFNEEKVICRTIESLLASDYPKLEIIIVDDGSSDETYQTAIEHFGDEAKRRDIYKTQQRQSRRVELWMAPGERRDHRGARRRYHLCSWNGLGSRAQICRRDGRRHGRECESRKPREPRHDMAGSRVRDVAEFRSPRILYA
jgi:hypothetical protein